MLYAQTFDVTEKLKVQRKLNTACVCFFYVIGLKNLPDRIPNITCGTMVGVLVVVVDNCIY